MALKRIHRNRSKTGREKNCCWHAYFQNAKQNEKKVLRPALIGNVTYKFSIVAILSVSGPRRNLQNKNRPSSVESRARKGGRCAAGLGYASPWPWKWRITRTIRRPSSVVRRPVDCKLEYRRVGLGRDASRHQLDLRCWVAKALRFAQCLARGVG